MFSDWKISRFVAECGLAHVIPRSHCDSTDSATAAVGGPPVVSTSQQQQQQRQQQQRNSGLPGKAGEGDGKGATDDCAAVNAVVGISLGEAVGLKVVRTGVI